MNTEQMSVRQAARWAEREGCVYRIHEGQPDHMAAAVDIDTNKVLSMGFGDSAYQYKRDHPDKAIRVYTMDEVLQGMSEEEGEAHCVPGARDAEAPWN